MSETQLLMTVSNFWVFLLGIISWNVALLFNEEDLVFREDFIFKLEGTGTRVLMNNETRAYFSHLLCAVSEKIHCKTKSAL